MGWDVVQIGLKHDLPVENPTATARLIAQRTNTNVHIMTAPYVCNGCPNAAPFTDNQAEYTVRKVTVNYDSRFIKMIVAGLHRTTGDEDRKKPEAESRWLRSACAGCVFESYELVMQDGRGSEPRIFRENVDLDLYFAGRWPRFEELFHEYGDHSYKKLEEYRNELFERSRIFGCSQIIICADQGPTQLIFDKMDCPADELLRYSRQKEYLRCDRDCRNDELWRKHEKHIDFKSYFNKELRLKKDDFVSVIYDDFSDLQ